MGDHAPSGIGGSSNTEAFVDLLVEAHVLRFGDFVLKSGQKSDFFIDFGRLAKGAHLRALGMHFAKAIVANGLGDCQAVFGPAYKGIPIATATSMALSEGYGIDMPYAFNRKQTKDYGEKRNFLGAELDDLDSVVVVDDVITDGGTKYEVIDMLKAFPRLQIRAFLVGVDRLEHDSNGRLRSEIFSETTNVSLISLADRQVLFSRRR